MHCVICLAKAIAVFFVFGAVVGSILSAGPHACDKQTIGWKQHKDMMSKYVLAAEHLYESSGLPAKPKHLVFCYLLCANETSVSVAEPCEC